MNKRLLFFALFLPLLSAAQVEHPNEIGVNVTPLLTRIFNVTSFVGVSDDPVSLSYKRVFSETTALRAQMGISHVTSVSNNSPNFQFSQWNTNVFSSLGWEWRAPGETRWIPYGGLDVVYSVNHTRTENSNDFDTTTTDQKTVGFGGGLVVGTQFTITPRLRLSTEASLLMVREDFSQEFHSENNPQSNSDSSSKGFSVLTQVPLAIFAIITI